MIKRSHFRRYWLAGIVLCAVAALIFFLTTNHPAIWPLRNVLSYQATTWWHQHIAAPRPAGIAELSGCIADPQRTPISGATILVAERDGTTHTATSDPTGCYRIGQIPAGRYVPVAGAFAYNDVAARAWGLPLALAAGQQRTLNLTLTPWSPPAVAAGSGLQIGEPVALNWPLPEPGAAIRRQIDYRSGGRPNSATFLYTPVTSTAQLPTLLAIYPGPVEGWEGVSIPLAAAGYAVIALGPEYTFDLEADIDELQRLIAFARAGKLPQADGRRMVALGGSYSSLHVQQLMQRDVNLRGAVLLGPPGDLFDLRRRFEAGSFFPPFGLDQALIALGTPDTAPERYWRYSFRYHLRPDLPPLLLMHSKTDEVVPFQQSQILAAELDRIGADYEAHFFAGMSHYLRANEPSEDLTTIYAITLDFLSRVTSDEPGGP